MIKNFFIGNNNSYFIKGSDTLFLIRTPYNARQYLNWMKNVYQKFGYSVLVQDVQGRYDSLGKWEPYKNEYADSFETLNFILNKNFKELVILGSSYEAFCARIFAFISNGNIYTKILLRVGVRSQKEALFNKSIYRIGDYTWWKNVHGTGNTSQNSENFNLNKFDLITTPPKKYQKKIYYPDVPAIIIGGWEDGYNNYAFDDYKNWYNENINLYIGNFSHSFGDISDLFNEINWYKRLNIVGKKEKIEIQNKDKVYLNSFFKNNFIKEYENNIILNIGNNITFVNLNTEYINLKDSLYLNLPVDTLFNNITLVHEPVENTIFGALYYKMNQETILLCEFLIEENSVETVLPYFLIKTTQQSKLILSFSNNLYPRYELKTKTIINLNIKKIRLTEVKLIES